MYTNHHRLIPSVKSEADKPVKPSKIPNLLEKTFTNICAIQERFTNSSHCSVSQSILSLSDVQLLKLFGKTAKTPVKRTKIQCILHYPLLITYLFVLLTVILVDAEIPGCPDLETIAKVDSYEGSFCFCNVKDDNRVGIRCLYGSTLEQFKRAMEAINAAQKMVDQVTFNRVEFHNATLPGKLFDGLFAAIRIISIDRCAPSTPLNIDDDAFFGLAEQLEELYITECNLERFPRMAVSHLTKLKKFSLAHNKLIAVEKDDLKPFKQLESLNLEGNFISSLENGTLSAIRKTLTTLSFGGHNFVNESVFREISQLGELQVLDMEQADGITTIPRGAFRELNKLEKLLLPGCSLTVIENDTFQGLTQLKQLDLRINLINKVECGSFAWTPNLRRLSLAGNYLNESLACWWDGLEHLKELDIGWNEFSTIENGAFEKTGPTLNALNIRHNTNLVQIGEDAFIRLSNLRSLTMNEISIAELNKTLIHLSSLKNLDLSNGKLQLIDEKSFEAQSESLERLLLRGNQLITISRSVIGNLKNLKELDLSNNPWLCDDHMEEVVEEIELKYEEAALMDRNFILLHANETICNRPYNLRGQIITNIIKNSFRKYNSSEDFQYLSLTPEAPPNDNGINFDEFNTSALTELLAEGGLIGSENAKAEHQQTTARFIRPLYDVNMRTELVDERSRTQFTPTVVAIAVLALVSIAITAAVVRHMKEQKKEQEEKRMSFEMYWKCRNNKKYVNQQRHSKN